MAPKAVSDGMGIFPPLPLLNLLFFSPDALKLGLNLAFDKILENKKKCSTLCSLARIGRNPGGLTLITEFFFVVCIWWAYNRWKKGGRGGGVLFTGWACNRNFTVY